MKQLEENLYRLTENSVSLSFIIPKFVTEKANCYWYGGSPTYDCINSYSTSITDYVLSAMFLGLLLYGGYKITRKISDYIYEKIFEHKDV